MSYLKLFKLYARALTVPILRNNVVIDTHSMYGSVLAFQAYKIPRQMRHHSGLWSLDWMAAFAGEFCNACRMLEHEITASYCRFQCQHTLCERPFFLSSLTPTSLDHHIQRLLCIALHMSTDRSESYRVAGFSSKLLCLECRLPQNLPILSLL